LTHSLSHITSHIQIYVYVLSAETGVLPESSVQVYFLPNLCQMALRERLTVRIMKVRHFGIAKSVSQGKSHGKTLAHDMGAGQPPLAEGI
jgi:hypothetical protein